MGILRSCSLLFIIGSLTTVSRSQTVNCGPTTDVANPDKFEPCTEPNRPIDNDNILADDDIDDVNDTSIFKGSAMYLVVVVIGIVALPLTLVLRLCWARNLQQHRLSAVDAARHMRHHDHLHRGGDMDIWSIDIGEFDYPVIPTYEQSLVSPVNESPPPYAELPPCYKDIVKFKLVTETVEPQPSTSTDTSDVTEQVHETAPRDQTGSKQSDMSSEQCDITRQQPGHGLGIMDNAALEDIVANQCTTTIEQHTPRVSVIAEHIDNTEQTVGVTRTASTDLV